MFVKLFFITLSCQLKGLNMTGNLPPEFANLTHLRELDLSRNYLNGSIPSRYGQLRVSILSLLGNRISGPIPKELGDIFTLEELNLENNLLEGPLPPNLGSLSRLRIMFLSANNLTGTIPENFSNLKNMTDFRIDGTSISGTIPDFIGNWTKMDRLDIQGTSMEGPIPRTLSQLKNMTELRISDLRGKQMQFPNLQDLKKMKRLTLRNCSIFGRIPDYVGTMRLKLFVDEVWRIASRVLCDKKVPPKLKGAISLEMGKSGIRWEWLPIGTERDLSNNMLNGPIPDTFRQLPFNNMFLGNNALSGEIPSWVFSSVENMLGFLVFHETPHLSHRNEM
ncbi:hypothetical protein H5410_059840 [Solanum commersonii]|uniref:Uncharacterized protein n=1 Tax=Solanum commersonii TaxID=4109 RepID=A0A9J5W3L4_SOLCO|nr:hypothetical protein H5410_059840 [Solanum commersonii]